MSRILVTGGTGVLGHEIVKQLGGTEHTIRIMSRRSQPATLQANQEWAQADLETGAGLKEAVAGVDVILHAASNPRQNTYQADVVGTRKLLEQAKIANVAHFVYISIVGIERIPFAYYNVKVEAENVIKASGVPNTILRATQFHDFVDILATTADRFKPFLFLPIDFQIQPVDVGEVAARMIQIAAYQPAGLLPDMGGPEVFRARDLVKIWLKTRGMRRIVLPLPMLGKVAHGFRNGYNTCPDHRDGKITWAQWLDRKYGK